MLPNTLDITVFCRHAEPRVFYNSPCRQAAYALIVEALEVGSACLWLTGPAGCGKSTLVQRCFAALPAVIGIFLDEDEITLNEVMSATYQRLGDEAGQRKYHNVSQFQQQLQQLLAQGKRVVYVVDGVTAANAASLNRLLQVNRLPNQSTALFTLLAISAHPADAIAAELGAGYRHCHLEPLKPADVNAFIQLQLQAAGHPENDFISPQAIELIIAAGEGLPGRINELCERVWQQAKSRGTQAITSAFVASVLQRGSALTSVDSGRPSARAASLPSATAALPADASQRPSSRRSRAWLGWAAAVGVIAVAVGAALLLPLTGDEVALSASSPAVTAPAPADDQPALVEAPAAAPATPEQPKASTTPPAANLSLSTLHTLVKPQDRLRPEPVADTPAPAASPSSTAVAATPAAKAPPPRPPAPAPVPTTATRPSTAYPFATDGSQHTLKTEDQRMFFELKGDNAPFER